MYTVQIKSLLNISVGSINYLIFKFLLTILTRMTDEI